MWTEKLGDLTAFCQIIMLVPTEDDRVLEPFYATSTDLEGNTYEDIEFVDPARDGETVMYLRADTVVTLNDHGEWETEDYTLVFRVIIPLTKKYMTKRALGIL